jgi:WD40 repeat protein
VPLFSSLRDIHITSVAFSPDGASVVAGAHDNIVQFWDVKTGVSLSKMKGHSNYVTSVALSMVYLLSLELKTTLSDSGMEKQVPTSSYSRVI